MKRLGPHFLVTTNADGVVQIPSRDAGYLPCEPDQVEVENAGLPGIKLHFDGKGIA